MNVLTVVGNLGKDAEVRHTQNGDPVAGFSVAFKSGFGQKAQTNWLDCSIWGKRAEGGLIPYLTKGTQVAVSGELGTREYNDKTYLTLRVSEITLVGDKPDSGRSPAAPSNGPDDSDIPF